MQSAVDISPYTPNLVNYLTVYMFKIILQLQFEHSILTLPEESRLGSQRWVCSFEAPKVKNEHSLLKNENFYDAS